MQIEVASAPNMPSKEKGDLLERFAEDFLRTQNYEVETQVRVTAAELDLLCKHRVKGLTLDVECKAHRDTLSANELTKLLGTVGFKNYDEGWLISAGALGKDAKGFQHEWELRPYEERRKLTIYTPDRIIDAFAAAGLIQLPPSASLPEGVSEGTRIGDWVLLITQNGSFWAAPTIEHSVPSGVVVVDATTGRLVTDAGLLREIGKTDTSLATLDLEFAARKPPSTTPATASMPPDKVVEVEHGDSWADYRPARPQDFVGRVDAQKTILSLLEDVHRRRTSTRVFAVTGDSGMGKSSLIAKLRARSLNQRNRGMYFIYAVDSRAATNATYIAASLVKALRDAAAKGFGEVAATEIEISDHADPLSSASIQALLESLERKRQIVCLVFDQFEELYSKPDLFPVFEEAQSLFLSAVSAVSSLVLGFAWRTDSMVQQDHPAYYMWHRLRDHRLEVALGPFPQTESSRAVTLFEKELGEKLRPEIRRQVLEISQGYPWLLKKMCMHLTQGEDWEDAEEAIVALRERMTRRADPISQQLCSVVADEVAYLHAMWNGDLETALERARKVADTLGGDESKGYRGWWYYLAADATMALHEATGDYVVHEAKSEHTPGDPIGINDVRQAQSHENWLRANRPCGSGTEILCLIESPRETVALDAVPHANSLYHALPEQMKTLLDQITAVLRQLRATMLGVSDEKALEHLHREVMAGKLTPREVVKRLSGQLVSKMAMSKGLSSKK